MREQKIIGMTEALEGELNLQNMLALGRNKYLLINLLARRSREINEGARPLVRTDGTVTSLDIALAEAKAGALKIELKQKEQVVVDLVDQT